MGEPLAIPSNVDKWLQSVEASLQATMTAMLSDFIAKLRQEYVEFQKQLQGEKEASLERLRTNQVLLSKPHPNKRRPSSLKPNESPAPAVEFKLIEQEREKLAQEEEAREKEKETAESKETEGFSKETEKETAPTEKEKEREKDRTSTPIASPKTPSSPATPHLLPAIAHASASETSSEQSSPQETPSSPNPRSRTGSRIGGGLPTAMGSIMSGMNPNALKASLRRSTILESPPMFPKEDQPAFQLPVLRPGSRIIKTPLAESKDAEVTSTATAETNIVVASSTLPESVEEEKSPRGLLNALKARRNTSQKNLKDEVKKEEPKVEEKKNFGLKSLRHKRGKDKDKEGDS